MPLVKAFLALIEGNILNTLESNKAKEKMLLRKDFKKRGRETGKDLKKKKKKEMKYYSTTIKMLGNKKGMNIVIHNNMDESHR